MTLEVAKRIPAERVVEALTAAFEEYGVLEHLRCDNGPEFVSWALRLFLEGKGVKHVTIQPGSQW